jgi:hypothetical protein
LRSEQVGLPHGAPAAAVGSLKFSSILQKKRFSSPQTTPFVAPFEGSIEGAMW